VSDETSEPVIHPAAGNAAALMGPPRGNGGGGGDAGGNDGTGIDDEGSDHRQPVTLTSDLHDDVESVRGAVAHGNRGMPSLFVTAGELTRLARTDEGHLVIKRHSTATFSHWVAQNSAWQRPTRNGGLVPCNPPLPAVTAVKETADHLDTAPQLERVVQVPFFTRERALAAARGYHASSRAWYQPSTRFTVPEVSEDPTLTQVRAAKALILEELLVDFPFASDGDRAGAVALLLEPFVKDVIQGATPLHLVEASTQGTGKTLLAKCCLAVSLGYGVREVPSKPLSTDESEIRKSITTDLMSGTPVIFFDNVSHSIKSASLAQALTAGVWMDRKLGGNENAEFPVRCSWVMTSNNASYDKDTARRLSLIRLDLSTLDVPSAVKEKPETRDPATLKHANLEGWVTDHQGRLIWAALTLVQAWVVLGAKPWSGKPLGSFESWSTVMGGILENADVDGFLSNRDQIEPSGGDERETVLEFLEAWWNAHRDVPVAPTQLAQLNIMLGSEDPGGLLGVNPKISASKAMGYWLKKHRDQVVGEFHLTKYEANERKWQLHRV
jgi:putative DNA primase/helicase